MYIKKKKNRFALWPEEVYTDSSVYPVVVEHLLYKCLSESTRLKTVVLSSTVSQLFHLVIPESVKKGMEVFSYDWICQFLLSVFTYGILQLQC